MNITRDAAEWAAELFESRTVEFATGGGSVHYAHPAYRVSWHEIVGRFPGMSGPTARVEFQTAFDAAIKRRGLLRVLRGTQTASDWYAKRRA